MAEPGLPSADRLMRRATFYLARQAASAARVRGVLERAIAKATREGEPPDPDVVRALVADVMARLTRAGLLDDAAFARAKAGSLARKGKPAGAIRMELKHRHGLALDDPSLAENFEGLDPLRQATRLAQRRRLGPFRLRDRAEKRERDIASLARAGFAVGVARAVIDGEGDGPDDGEAPAPMPQG